MTCIIGYIGDDHLYMGGDSILSSGWYSQTVIPAKKVFRIGDMLLGVSGEARLTDILRYQFKALPRNDYSSDDEFLVCGWADALRKYLESINFVTVTDGRSVLNNSAVMIGYHRRLFTLDDVFHVKETTDKYRTIGSGSEYAIGCLDALTDDKSPEECIRYALAIAARRSSGTGEPFYVEKI